MLTEAIDLSNEATNAIAPSDVGSAKAWLSADISEDDWLIPLSQQALDEIAAMAKQMREQPLPIIMRKPDQFDIPALEQTVRSARRILDEGCGFCVIDRLPMDDFEEELMAACFWVTGQLIAPPVAQKWDGTMLYDVTDTGKKYSYGVRGSHTAVELVFHTDNAFGIKVPEYVGLLCKYPAVEGGISRFCSLYTLHDRLLEKYPDLLKRLHEPMHFDRQAEHMPGAPKTSYAPFFAWRDGKLAARANVSLVRKGYDVAGVEMDDTLADALKAVEEISAGSDLWYEAPIERGQMQYLNNHELGHYRSEFKDHSDPQFKRHLFRTWHRRSGHTAYDG